MSNRETLSRAIQKAIDNGWKAPASQWEYETNPTGDILIRFKPQAEGEYNAKMNIEKLIFDHGFTKALWGENNYKETQGDVGVYTTVPTWKWHIQTMVLEENPIKYLSENI